MSENNHSFLDQRKLLAPLSLVISFKIFLPAPTFSIMTYFQLYISFISLSYVPSHFLPILTAVCVDLIGS